MNCFGFKKNDKGLNQSIWYEQYFFDDAGYWCFEKISHIIGQPRATKHDEKMITDRISNHLQLRGCFRSDFDFSFKQILCGYP